MGGETSGGRIKGEVARRGSTVYKQKLEFDEQPWLDWKKYVPTER